MNNAKDRSLKYLYRHDDVYADILNGLLFKGEQVIRMEDLAYVDTVTEYEGENRELCEQLRDTSRYWIVNGKIIARFSLANMTRQQWHMVPRTFSYDGTSYGWQFTKDQMKKNQTTIENPGHLVITAVLSFDRRRWGYSSNLNDIMKADQRLRPFAPDYHMNLFELAWMTPEEVKQRFRSDFRIIADYVSQMRMKDSYQLSDYPMEHPDDIMKVMNAFSGKNWISQELKKMMKEGERISMVSAYREVRKEAREEDARDNRNDNAMRMLKGGRLSNEDISEYTGLSLAEVEELKKNLK